MPFCDHRKNEGRNICPCELYYHFSFHILGIRFLKFIISVVGVMS